jgi:hypothetical protein
MADLLKFPKVDENIFELFDEQPEWKVAEKELKAACLLAATVILGIQNKYVHCGASDTDSRRAITDHINDLLLDLAASA